MIATLGVLAAALAATAGIGSAAPERTADTKLSLVAYSTPREAYGKLIPAFQKTAAGKDVDFTQSYGSFGRAGARGQGRPRGRHRRALARSGCRRARRCRNSSMRSGRSSPSRAWSHNSVVVFVVRDGNPKKIKSWNDLLRPDVEVVTPNPFTSGGARWNVMAAYGAWRKVGKTDKQAQANLLKLFKNVVVQDTSARASLNTFNSGKGDVLLAYENEALLLAHAGTEPAVGHPEGDDPHREPDRGHQVEP